MGLDYTMFFFFFSFGWIKHSILHTRVFQVNLPYNNQNPKSFLSFNIQLPSSSINAMEFQKNISVSMMHTFGYFCILYRKRFSIYSDCTFLHNFNGPPPIPIVLFFTILIVLVYALQNEFFLRFNYSFLSFAYAFLPFCQ